MAASELNSAWPAGQSAEADLVIRYHAHYQPRGSGWLGLPPDPTAYEINRPADQVEALPKNEIEDPWGSKTDYLETLYRILRYEGTESLRHSVEQYKLNPAMLDNQTTCVYTKVHVVGYLLTNMGAFCRIRFSARRAGMAIKWQQSRRLMPHNIVAISTAADNFKTICKVAKIAQRPFRGYLDQNPPLVEIFWTNYQDAVWDPNQELVMVEARTGYWESITHALTGLQHAASETTVLDKYIVSGQQKIDAPRYIKEQPLLNISSYIHQAPPNTDPASVVYELARVRDRYQAINILEEIPDEINSISSMDRSQIEASQCMLSQEMTIIQGPPGTGKTFTSLATLKVHLANRKLSDPPVVISAQTNHALDQLILHLMEAGVQVMRIGTRTEDDRVAERTVYRLRRMGAGRHIAQKSFRALNQARHNHINELMQKAAMAFPKSLLSSDTLLRLGILSQEQVDSLLEDDEFLGDSSSIDNIKSESGSGEDMPSDRWSEALQIWLGEQCTSEAAQVDPEYEIIEDEAGADPLVEIDISLDRSADGDDEDDIIRGTFVPLSHNFTGKPSSAAMKSRDRKTPEHWLKKQSLNMIPSSLRGDVYRHLQAAVVKACSPELVQAVQNYERIRRDWTVCKWSNSIKLVPAHKIEVVGCTTTGLSKYRGLIAALRPSVLLIEEAAETREANIVSALFPTLQQLILVGDHQQLTPKCDIRNLTGPPFNLDVSLFERLIKIQIPYCILTHQRRMKPELRGVLDYFYSLEDHPLVRSKVNRPDVAGMGGRNMWMFHHSWIEATNADCSKYNREEARMIARFFTYLVNNKVDPSRITILTFYNGQRKELYKALRDESRGISSFNVFTVDSYQGEENDIILLSLVRSPRLEYDIGFLEDKNRVTVAISRARCGFYIFGNIKNMLGATAESLEVWGKLQHYFAKMQSIGEHIPIVCQNHGLEVWMTEPDDFVGNAGGCNQPCAGKLPCGHPCQLKCHARDHSEYACSNPCTKILFCGHKCSNTCTGKCNCTKCCFEATQSAVESIVKINFHGQISRMNIRDIDRKNGKLLSDCFSEQRPSPFPGHQGVQSQGRRSKAWQNFFAMAKEEEQNLQPADESVYAVDRVITKGTSTKHLLRKTSSAKTAEQASVSKNMHAEKGDRGQIATANQAPHHGILDRPGWIVGAGTPSLQSEREQKPEVKATKSDLIDDSPLIDLL